MTDGEWLLRLFGVLVAFGALRAFAPIAYLFTLGILSLLALCYTLVEIARAILRRTL